MSRSVYLHLLSLVENRQQPKPLRIQAIHSLRTHIEQRSVYLRLISVAENSSEDIDIRMAATSALGTRGG